MIEEAPKFNHYYSRLSCSVEVMARSRGSFESPILYQASIKSSTTCWLHTSVGKHSSEYQQHFHPFRRFHLSSCLKNMQCISVSRLFLFVYSSYFIFIETNCVIVNAYALTFLILDIFPNSHFISTQKDVY